MTAPMKPRAAKVTPAPATELTAGQLRAAQLLGLMSDGAQSAVLDLMAGMAESCPRHKRPALRLSAEVFSIGRRVKGDAVALRVYRDRIVGRLCIGSVVQCH